MRSYSALSDHDFEMLVADLFTEEYSQRYEVFSRGPDRGIDLRHIRNDERYDVIQCKHMAGSTFTQLKSAARQEARKLAAVNATFASYRLVCTQPLTATKKHSLCRILEPWLQAEDDVYGAEDLEGLLNRHPRIERSHVKLWLTSGAQLQHAVHSRIWSRSQHLYAQVRASLPLYAETGEFPTAKNRLLHQKVLIISGPPGIGKTTLARMLLADCVSDGYEPIDVSGDIEEGYSVFDATAKQVFFLDDFLGATFLQDRLAKNEDKRLTSFMRRCVSSPGKLMILSTREHILNQAKALYEELAGALTDHRKLLLELKSYSRIDKAQILYNHLWHSSQVTTHARRQIAESRRYVELVDHSKYNPRVIEYVTGMAAYQLKEDDQENYVDFVTNALDDPKLIWRYAFENQLDDNSKDVLVALSSAPRRTSLDDLETAFEGQVIANGREIRRGLFRDAMRVLDGSFVETTQEHTTLLVQLRDPGIEDFVSRWCRSDRRQAVATVQGIRYFDQLPWVQRAVVQETPSSWRRTLIDLVWASAKRSWDDRNCGWGEVHFANEREPVIMRDSRDPSERLSFLLNLREQYPHADPSHDQWIKGRIVGLAEAWSRSIINYNSRVSIVLRLHSAGWLSPRIATELRDELVASANHGYAWQELQRLAEGVPDLFDDATIRTVRRRYRSWMEEELKSDWENISSYDLGVMAETAKGWGSAIPKRLYKEVHDYVSQRELDHDDDYLAERSASSEHVNSITEAREIEKLFSRFLA